MKNILIILLAALPLVLTTCKPDDELVVDGGEYRLGPEGEAYIKFEPGSYWVYQNDVTSELDTVTMMSYDSRMIHFQGKRNNYYREDIAFQWRGTKSSVYNFQTLHPFVDLTYHQMIASLQHFALPASNKGNSISMMYMPADETGGGGVSGQVTSFVKQHDSLLVQGRYYYDVAEFEVDKDYSWDRKIVKYYWARNIGLIKKEQYAHWTREQEETWELTNYNVIQ